MVQTVKTLQSFTDTLRFSNAADEQARGLAANGGDIITGGLGEPARRLLPQIPASWEGGTTSFRMKVNPDVDQLDFGTDGDSPSFNGRFFYNTTPLRDAPVGTGG